MRRPAILIYNNNAPAEMLKEICAGIEEEGVLFETERQTGGEPAVLAYEAANASLLHVGIGADANGAAMQMRHCPVDKPVFTVLGENGQAYRRIGINSARAVKGGVFV